VLTDKGRDFLTNVCLNLGEKYEIEFLEIGTDKNHVHYLVQLGPKMSVSDCVRIIKSITGRKMFKMYPELGKILRKRQFWSEGYFACTIGQYMNEKAIAEYVKNQGYDQYEKEYEQADNRKI